MKPGVLHFQTDCLWQVSVQCVQVTAKAGSKLVHVSVIQFLHWTGHFLDNDVLQKNRHILYKKLAYCFKT